MPEAARLADPTSHGTPLGAGPGSSDVFIGYMPAWRAVPASVAAAIDGISNAMKSFMDQPQLNPAAAASDLAQISQKLAQGGADAAAAGAPAAAGAASSQTATLNTTNTALATTWTTASAAPGGQPAADVAYTEGIKAAAAAAATAVMSAMASLSDMHTCPTPCPVPPHGPGFVTKGSSTVLINNLPATRKDDKVMEACGGADPISMGCSTVLIDDQTGSGSGGGGAGPDEDGLDAGDEAGEAETQETPPHEDYAETEPASPPPGESTKKAGAGTHWIELEMVDEAEQPVVGEAYVVRLPNGKEQTGGLDAKGTVRITGIEDPGACSIKFPKLDLAAWERWRPGPSTSSAPSAGGASPAGAGEDDAPVPAGLPSNLGEWRQARQGECISSIARDTGHFWNTIWDHAANATLRQRRGNPNVLLAGDAVFVPGLRPREESGAVDQRHKFRRRGEPAQLWLQIADDDEPRANTPYVLEIDGQEFTGVTDAGGNLNATIPGNARRAHLRIGQPGEEDEYDLDLGTVDPIETSTGIRQRLENLGLLKPGDGDEEFVQAVRTFQDKRGLTVSGEVDAPTRERLLQEHGS